MELREQDMTSLRRLLDEAEIRNLIARVAHLADDGDIDEYLSHWCEDASWGGSGRPLLSGQDALRAGVLQRREEGIQGPGAGTRHVNTTLWVEVDVPAGTASAQSYFVLLAPEKDTNGHRVARTGRYDDRFRRTADGWKFVSRQITAEVN
ncbi:nuclear transport factor 2 family protein [Amycolatopsis sp. GM8]|uniref:nuclear transport factor 2 family protein n=1 Tax=Amycolatopsis sp. GM8 TaxID=2896530 RepID=UPI001F39607B|nr:nuclear transport factor 2 family protein [Amycolatopsis sp. GM8]